MSREWFQKHVSRTSSSFEAWWLKFYGSPEDYADADDFWMRKAFAWHGWEARGDVVLAEREACARLCDAVAEEAGNNTPRESAAIHCAERIRGRPA